MKTAVLCPGPSLATTWKGRTGFDQVYGVNRAVHREACDTWVFLDPHAVHRLPLRWFTGIQIEQDLRTDGRVPPACKVEPVERFFEACPTSMSDPGWTTRSSLTALIRAYIDGASSIDVYGYDGTSAPDFDGVSQPSDKRDRERWEAEAKAWDQVTRWLAARGCVVNRIRP